ncbi:A24 family peptidase [Marinomonas pontica]|uniref:prepilin peptidase n=1 Tax=Marinomonas pontica TaxID=264739 RepID=UPI00224345DB|nr:A24 family peptidase [Marinomonas pontica]MCW8355199.1 A24 family peptidase [Marinomonas pontica]
MYEVIFIYLIYASLVLSIGSYSAAYTRRWPIRQTYLWEKEAHHILSIPFRTSNPEDAQSKRSFCVHCRHLLSWKDLIPVLSFIALKGRCRYCKNAISYRYSIIELAHLALCLPLLSSNSNISELLLLTILISALITAGTVDLENKLIPDECSAIILTCGLLLHLFSSALSDSVLGMLMGYALVYSLHWAYLTFRQCEAIGLGDAKLLAALGAWLGLSNMTNLLLCASLGGILYTVVFKKKGSEHITFGPFLIFSALLIFYISL